MSTEEIFACGLCSKAFTLRSRYNQHIRTHTKPWKCQLCPRGFGLRADLNRHTLSQHSVGFSKHKCSIEGCNFSATRKDNLRQHLKKMHASHTMNRQTITLLQSTERQEPPVKAVSSPVLSKSLYMQAASMGNLHLLIILLHSGQCIDSIADDGSTALHCAARTGQLAILQYLTNANAQINLENSRKRTPLMEAALGRHSACILFLLRHDANTGANDQSGLLSRSRYFFIQQIVRIGNVELVEAILRDGKLTRCPFDASDFASVAAALGQVKILELLQDLDGKLLKNVDALAPINWHGRRNQRSVLWHAVSRGQEACVHLLLTPSAIYNAPRAASQPQSLFKMAARKGFTEVCKTLVENKVFHYFILDDSINEAARNGRLPVVKFIVDCANSGYLSQSLELDKPMLEAFWTDHLDIVKYLLRLDEDPGSPDSEHNAVASRVELAKSLLFQGKLRITDQGHVDSNYRRPYGYVSLVLLAVERDDSDLAEFLVNHQDYNHTTIDETFRWPGKRWEDPKRTALDVAQLLGHTRIADLLIAHGATDHHFKPQSPLQPGQTTQQGQPLSASDSDLEMRDDDDPDSDFGSDSES